MGVRDYLGAAPAPTTIEVEFEGDKFMIQGSPDANILATSVMLPPDRIALYCKHWQTVTGRKIEAAMVPHIWLVFQTLLPMKWNRDSREWEQDQPYDIMDIVNLACTQSKLFLTLMAAAYQACGLVTENPAEIATLGERTLDMAMAGKSETPTDSSTD